MRKPRINVSKLWENQDKALASGITIPVGSAAPVKSEDTIISTSKAPPARPKRRRQGNLQAQARYAKIRSVPRNLPLNKYASKMDGMHSPLKIPQGWLNKGCPTTYSAALKDRNWRKAVGQERANAWASTGKKRTK